jgi:hypothetical protein
MFLSYFGEQYQKMSTAIPQIQIRMVARAKRQLRLHRWLLLFCGLAAFGLAVVLSFYGRAYYSVGQAQRPFSSMHPYLKPSGMIGLRLGMLGFFLFALVYLYPLRKSWKWLGRQGKTAHWLDYHILMGLVAPILIAFHCSFKTQGFAGIAFWTMVALAISGIIGRYFYAQIPRSLDAAMMSLREMDELQTRLARQLAAQSILPASELERCLRLPNVKRIEAMPAVQAAFLMLKSDLVLPPRIWRLRRRALGKWAVLSSFGGVLPTINTELEKAVAATRRQAALSKKILFLSKTQRIFHYWHVVHRPFSYSFAVLVLIHVTVAVLLGYF